MADLANEEKPAIAPPVFVFQKDKAQKRSADGSSAEDGDDSDRDDVEYCPPVKRERTSSLTQFPPSHSVPKNNIFMPSSLCQSPTGNSDSEPEEKPVGFRLKPPTLIHGQAPSSGCFPGVPSQKPKEQQRSVLRPAVLQAPPAKTLTEPVKTNSSCGTNGVGKFGDSSSESRSVFLNNTESSDKSPKREKEGEENGGGQKDDSSQKKDCAVDSSFVFGQNIKERAKLDENSTSSDSTQDSQSGGTNYFLQYMGSASSNNATNSSDKGSKFVFGQNMSERVLSPPTGGEAPTEAIKDSSAPASEPSSQEATPEKNHSVTESLEESAAAYTKATAKKCILEKVEVRTGEEAESNVLQMQCKLFVFDKPAQSWVERGRGLLRLNDMASTDDGSLQSRLVMRTQGSLRLILNTKLWPQMQVDKASEKSVRITAMDTEDQGVKVFLISASSKDAGQLAAALHHRILALRSRVEPDTENTPAPAEPEIPQSSDDDEPTNNSSATNSTGTGNSTSSGNCENSETPAGEST
ncbi:ran-binding protein 3-like isoform X1 [Pimephales promelas]|uniref:ran-binding protein 3-like isoform X1 n=1 Tax=Pimephales promelas TaxID=90988 RepID=UPI0019555341|nr:ran-binding protein 3-like isoform X1 [Pimephales promelas]XP_039504928.1 ran-binding protein 3-like isoform X1 [Pimephales promelas]